MSITISGTTVTFNDGSTQSSTGASNFSYFTSSGTWTKPAGISANAAVIVYCLGAGGGGSTYSNTWPGGGGAAGVIGIFRAGDLGATEAVVVGAGGAPGNPRATDGGNSSFNGFFGYGGSGSWQNTGGAPGGITSAGTNTGTVLSPGGGVGSLYYGSYGSGSGQAEGGIHGAGGGSRPIYPGGTSVFAGKGGGSDGAPGPGGGGSFNQSGGNGWVKIWVVL